MLFIVDPSALTYGGVEWIERWRSTGSTYFIPQYTLKELRFLRNQSRNTIIAKNAARALQFIDENVGSLEDSDIEVDIEQPGYTLPWGKAANYSIRKPHSSGFASTDFRDGDSSGRAVMPRWRRSMVCSCIQKQFIEGSDDEGVWIVLCEDSETRIWLESFGLTVANLSEANQQIQLSGEGEPTTAQPLWYPS